MEAVWKASPARGCGVERRLRRRQLFLVWQTAVTPFIIACSAIESIGPPYLRLSAGLRPGWPPKQRLTGASRSPLRSLPLRDNAAVAEHKRASARAVRCGHRKPDGGCAARRRRRGALPALRREISRKPRQGLALRSVEGRCLHRPATP